ncbi:MAG TPA: hypothetical protein V6D06_20455, partial [Trichocoleus sp.]
MTSGTPSDSHPNGHPNGLPNLSSEPPAWLELPGKIVPGHQVASGRSADSPYPRGTIDMQIPHFKARGLDLSAMFPATLNVSVAPYVPLLKAPEITFAEVKWSPPHPP